MFFKKAGRCIWLAVGKEMSRPLRNSWVVLAAVRKDQTTKLQPGAQCLERPKELHREPTGLCCFLLKG